jgi:hypothetical protein
VSPLYIRLIGSILFHFEKIGQSSQLLVFDFLTLGIRYVEVSGLATSIVIFYFIRKLSLG